MKKTKNLIIFVLFALVLNLSSCEPVGLPDITETGENTFGMKVDGKDWIASSFVLEPSELIVRYSSINNGLKIIAYNRNKKEHAYLYIPNVFGLGDYFFACEESFFDMSKADSIHNYCNTRFTKDSVTYYREREFALYNTEESNIHITKLDTIKKIISGTFSVNLYNNRGEKLEITDGRFDVEYTFINLDTNQNKNLITHKNLYR